MKNYLAIILLLITACMANAQSKTTEALHKKNEGALSLFFYNNTLRMLNQTEDKEFDELIKDIEKMKFLMIKKDAKNLDATQFKKLISDYKAESFEEIMTSRYQGKNFDVYVKEKDGKTKGMIVTVNDTESLYVLDIVGSIALNKITSLFSTIDRSSDIGQKIKAFMNEGKDKNKDDN